MYSIEKISYSFVALNQSALDKKRWRNSSVTEIVVGSVVDIYGGTEKKSIGLFLSTINI